MTDSLSQIAKEVFDNLEPSQGTYGYTAARMRPILEKHYDYATHDRYDFLKACEKMSRSTYDISNLLGMAQQTKEAQVATSQPQPDADPTVMNTEVSIGAKVAKPQPTFPENVTAIQPKLKTTNNLTSEVNMIPKKDDLYIKWGNFNDVKTVISSKMFFPVFISGLSGNGKSMMVEQACAHAKREYVRVQCHTETSEDDLIGGMRLINGDTVFVNGPVVDAMLRGAVLLLDEIDRSSDLIMCLQGVLEGGSFLIKKTGRVIEIAEGFTVVATGNSKGKGSSDGEFAVNVMDEAFLERFKIHIEQEYPSAAVEKKMILTKMKYNGVEDTEVADRLVMWASAIRKTADKSDGGIPAISTRRIIHVVDTFAIFKKIDKAVELCVSRFEDDIKIAFLKMWEISAEQKPESEESDSSDDSPSDD